MEHIYHREKGPVFRILVYGLEAFKEMHIGVVMAFMGLIFSFGYLRPHADVRGQQAINMGNFLARALACCHIFYVIVFNVLANIPLTQPLAKAVHSRFWMQPNLVLAIWGGIGFSSVSYRSVGSFRTFWRAIIVSIVTAQYIFNYPNLEVRRYRLHLRSVCIITH